MDRTLVFPNFTVTLSGDGNSLSIEIYKSRLSEERGTVTGFRFSFRTEVLAVIVKTDKRRELDRWFIGKFRPLFLPELKKNILSEYPLDKWFPYAEFYDVDVTVSVGMTSHLTATIEIFVTVHFSREVPYKQFDADTKRFLSETHGLRKFEDLITKTVEDVVNKAFPNSVFLIHTQLLSTIRTFGDEGRRELRFPFPNFVRIDISLRKPLHENVCQSLLNSSSEREFVFKLSILIDRKNVEDVSVRYNFPSRTIRAIRKFNDVIEFLSEVTTEE